MIVIHSRHIRYITSKSSQDSHKVFFIIIKQSNKFLLSGLGVILLVHGQGSKTSGIHKLFLITQSY